MFKGHYVYNGFFLADAWIQMGESFNDMIVLFESMVFFAGYPIVYFLIRQLGLWIPFIRKHAYKLLPISYAFTSSLYFGYLMKKWYEYSAIGEADHVFSAAFPQIWGYVAVCFWLPYFIRRPFISLLHSLFYFVQVPIAIFYYLSGKADILYLKNMMNVLTLSILINVTTLFFMTVISALRSRFR